LTQGPIYERFGGREPTLKVCISDLIGERSSNQYTQTTKENANYVARAYHKYTSEFTNAIIKLELQDPIIFEDINPTNRLEFETWELDIEEQRRKVQEYVNFHQGLYNVVLDPCTESLQDKLKSYSEFGLAHKYGIELLLLIKELTYPFEERKRYLTHCVKSKKMFTA
jgi:hypothetical protein